MLGVELQEFGEGAIIRLKSQLHDEHGWRPDTLCPHDVTKPDCHIAFYFKAVLRPVGETGMLNRSIERSTVVKNLGDPVQNIAAADIVF